MWFSLSFRWFLSYLYLYTWRKRNSPLTRCHIERLYNARLTPLGLCPSKMIRRFSKFPILSSCYALLQSQLTHSIICFGQVMEEQYAATCICRTKTSTHRTAVGCPSQATFYFTRTWTTPTPHGFPSFVAIPCKNAAASTLKCSRTALSWCLATG